MPKRMLIATAISAVFSSGTAAAQQAAWVEFPAGQSRLEFKAPGMASKPSRGWELQNGSKLTRDYQYLWGTPFRGEAAFARIFLAQIKDSGTYFSREPEWDRLDKYSDLRAQNASASGSTAMLAGTDGLGKLKLQHFSAGGRFCIAFGGLTNAGASSQLLYGSAMSTGDTSVRGFYCAEAGRDLLPEAEAVLATLRFR